MYLSGNLPTTVRSPAEEDTERIHAVDFLHISELQLQKILSQDRRLGDPMT